jgi:hypothetical protein
MRSSVEDDCADYPMLLILGKVHNPTWLLDATALTSDCSIRAGYNADGNSANKVARSRLEGKSLGAVATLVPLWVTVRLNNLRFRDCSQFSRTSVSRYLLTPPAIRL